MFKTWIGILAVGAVVAGILLACRPGTAAEPVFGAAGAESGDATRPPAKRGNFPRAFSATGQAGDAARFAPVPANAGSSTTVNTGPKLPDEPLMVLKSGADHTRVVCYLSHCPAAVVAQELDQLFRLEAKMLKSTAVSRKSTGGSNVAIVPNTVDNSLLISGSPEAVAEVQSLLEKMDQPAGMILLEMEIGDAPVDDSKSNDKSPAISGGPFRLPQSPEKMEITARARLITSNNQPAYVQMGSRVPHVASVSNMGPGGQARSITYQNVGLILGITPRISTGEVSMQIDVEQSQLGPESEGVPLSTANDSVRAPVTDSTTIQTTVRIANGQTVILGSIGRRSKSGKQLVVIITPHIIGLEEAKKVR
jgi:hypothetical protein